LAAFQRFLEAKAVARRKERFPRGNEQNPVDCCLDALPIDFTPPSIQPPFCSFAMKGRGVLYSGKPQQGENNSGAIESYGSGTAR
jgi:hypothetical protein